MKRRAVVEVLTALVLLAGCDGTLPDKPRLTVDDYHKALMAICQDAITNASAVVAAREPSSDALQASRRWNDSCQRELTTLQNKGRT